MSPQFQCGRFLLDLRKPQIMGIVNVTRDSFSGDGLAGDAQAAIDRAWRLVEQGAQLLDIGGESSRPGAEPVSVQAELDAVLPVVAALRECGVPLSVDTVKPEVMRAALAEGADMINDIAAFSAPGAWQAVANGRAGLCLMHMQGAPRTMQRDPQYADVVGEVAAYLAERVKVAEAAGIARARLVVDPGFGFGKTQAHNVDLLRCLDRLAPAGIPLLVGMSRKSMLGHLTGRPVEGRTYGGVAADLLAVQRGARILRVHDVAAARDMLSVWAAIEGESNHE